ncbi:GDSL esterase/lipase At1g06990-like [Durio zibethinus]|uniref:GDSL esterase/lipase At1g06990-like n=1 Tax=Durio zibethinus TaxID=66656 RepID=A0A6P5XKJ2_DURZI|nr:GDSL esterase/lipase At1g06990-like [Durio zibethinus]
MATTTLFIISLLHTWMNCISTSHIMKPSTLPKFTAIFIFGDSTVETVTKTTSTHILRPIIAHMANIFPSHSYREFSNGKLVPDYLASSQGIKDTIPPFLNPNLSDNDLRTGVNFTSAGSGYDDLTSKLSSSIPLSGQIELFRCYLEKLEGTVGEEKAKTMIGGAVVQSIKKIVTVNTILSDLYLQDTCSPNKYLELFTDTEKSTYRNCMILDSETCSISHDQAWKSLEEDARKIKIRLHKIIMASLRTQIKLLTSESQMEQPYRFEVTDRSGCFGTGLVEASFLCNPLTPTCENAS